MTGRETEAQGWEVTRLNSQAVGGTAGVLGEAGGLRFQLSGDDRQWLHVRATWDALGKHRCLS